jgi:hypothetical protein
MRKNIPILFAGILIFIIGISFLSFGWTETWTKLFVPTMHPPFADLRTVQGSLVSFAAGFEPQLINPGDPWDRPMNYPLIWMYIAKLFSLDNEINYLTFVLIFVSIYIFICLNILRNHQSFWLLITLFSGSSLLAIERGNNDLIIFIILYMASIVPALSSMILIVFATTLKIYPIFSIFHLQKNNKILFISLFLLGIYFLFQIPELIKLKSSTPTAVSLGYGAPSIAETIKYQLKFEIAPVVVALLMISFSIVVSNFKRVIQFTKVDSTPSSELNLFLIGSLIYCGTFLIAGNWDYRLIFLIFCIPYIEKSIKGKLRLLMLISIVFASNQIILTYLVGKFIGMILCIASKCFLFFILSIILLNNFFDFKYFQNKYRFKIH